MKNKWLIFSISVIILKAVLLLPDLIWPKINTNVLLEKEKSYFNDFSVAGSRVYIHCNVVLKNTGNNAVTVRLHAFSLDDVTGGLLKQKELENSNADNTPVYYYLPPQSEKSFTVTFTGEYGGTSQKHNRLLPEIQMETVQPAQG